MNYKFTIISNERSDFKREIILKDDHSFELFHEAIQECVNYDSTQLASFFIADEGWGKQIEISQLDLGINNLPTYVMHKVKLKELIYKEHQKLLYVFDFFYDRFFFIELSEISTNNNINKPMVTMKEGIAPAQLLEEDSKYNDPKTKNEEVIDIADFGDLDDYTEIYGEIEDLN